MSSRPAVDGWSDDDVVLVARVTGHDMTNLVQVVDGWLQLGEIAEARKALAQMAAGHVAEARALQSCPAALAAELVMASVRARAEGIAWHFEAGGELRADVPDGVRPALRAVFDACREAAAAGYPDVAIVPGSPANGRGLACEVAGPVPRDQVARLASFGEAFRSAGLDVSCETIDAPAARADQGRTGRGLRVNVRWSGNGA